MRPNRSRSASEPGGLVQPHCHSASSAGCEAVESMAISSSTEAAFSSGRG